MTTPRPARPDETLHHILMAARHDVLPHEPANQMRIMWWSEWLHRVRGRIAPAGGWAAGTSRSR